MRSKNIYEKNQLVTCRNSGKNIFDLIGSKRIIYCQIFCLTFSNVFEGETCPISIYWAYVGVNIAYY